MIISARERLIERKRRRKREREGGGRERERGNEKCSD